MQINFDNPLDRITLILDKYIASLLYDHNCVIIPGFGAFIANYKASEINETQQLIKPPGKRIAFNPSLTSNDALLIHLVAKEEELTFDQAADEINVTTRLWNENLKKGQTIRLNKIGELSLNENKKINFKPYHSINFLKDSFGLPDVSIKPLSPKRIILDVNSLIEFQEEKNVAIESSASNKKNRRIVYYAVSAYIPVLVALWALFLLKEPFTGQEGGFNIFSKSKVVDVAASETTEGDLAVGESVTFDQEPEIEEVFIPEIPSGPFYYIIGGSFKESTNAEVFHNQLIDKNYSRSEILGSTMGYFRVSYDRFELSDIALKQLHIINENENSTAWILKQ